MVRATGRETRVWSRVWVESFRSKSFGSTRLILSLQSSDWYALVACILSAAFVSKGIADSA
jgi:hypothetical protein